MKLLHTLITNRKIRFGMVGVANTLLNFLILNISFYRFGQTKITSSIIATLFAVTISFFLNRSFVFRHNVKSLRVPLLFVAVTITGVLLVQNVIYAIFVMILKDHTMAFTHAMHVFTGLKLGSDFFDINISNFIASLCAMIWNYNGYRLFVFKEMSPNEAIAATA